MSDETKDSSAAEQPQPGPGVVGRGEIRDASYAWEQVAWRVMQILNQRSCKILLHVDPNTKEFGVRVVW